MSDTGAGATPELAYAAAREILAGDDDDLRLGPVRVHRLDDERWRVLRREQHGNDVIDSEADILWPDRFRTAQTLAAYLLGIATSDRDEWPLFVPKVTP